ncbi:MAG: sigma-70 family RNA polymerase sigma factor, partial [Candidatus Eremiobacteraeota bacterium]|nr:sigma-70 family RNA polymerase sigma factor [Candidatus Eremiobacteraeota bacterium]
MQDAGRLIARIRERDAAAFEALYDAFSRLVYGIALRMVGDVATAEDVTQNVFLTVWTRPEAFREGNVAAWLSRVTRNRCLDVLRSRASHQVDEVPVDIPAENALEDEILQRVDGAQVRAALASLPQDQRAPIEMGFFGGITHDEIARRTGIPLGTIKTRIRTGLRRLRAHLEGV